MLRHTWAVAFAFGLLHGFGFAGGLSSLGLPPAELPLALLTFNLGVEAGQIMFVALLLLLAWSWRVLQVQPAPLARLAPAYLIGSLGAFWTIDRLLLLMGEMS